MKMFLFEYDFEPNHKECSVVLASNIEEAKNIVMDEYGRNYTFFDSESAFNLVPATNKTKKCIVKEHKIEKGIVYTGSYGD